MIWVDRRRGAFYNIYMPQIIRLCALILYSVICQLYFCITGGIKGEEGTPFRMWALRVGHRGEDLRNGLSSQGEGLYQAWQRQRSRKWSLAEDCGIFQGEGDLEVVLEVWWPEPRVGARGECVGQGADLRASLQEKVLGSSSIGVLVIMKRPSFNPRPLSMKVGDQLP